MLPPALTRAIGQPQVCWRFADGFYHPNTTYTGMKQGRLLLKKKVLKKGSLPSVAPAADRLLGHGLRGWQPPANRVHGRGMRAVADGRITAATPANYVQLSLIFFKLAAESKAVGEAALLSANQAALVTLMSLAPR